MAKSTPQRSPQHLCLHACSSGYHRLGRSVTVQTLPSLIKHLPLQRTGMFSYSYIQPPPSRPPHFLCSPQPWLLWRALFRPRLLLQATCCVRLWNHLLGERVVSWLLWPSTLTDFTTSCYFLFQGNGPNLNAVQVRHSFIGSVLHSHPTAG
jgi:hypothetical protein